MSLRMPSPLQAPNQLAAEYTGGPSWGCSKATLFGQPVQLPGCDSIGVCLIPVCCLTNCSEPHSTVVRVGPEHQLFCMALDVLLLTALGDKSYLEPADNKELQALGITAQRSCTLFCAMSTFHNFASLQGYCLCPGGRGELTVGLRIPLSTAVSSVRSQGQKVLCKLLSPLLPIPDLKHP